jgi:outer membrane protein assembly factor BamD
LIRAKTLLPLLFIFIIFTGCAKDDDEYNKPAMYWYSKIVENVSIGNLDKADGYYSSLQGEHIGSPLLREATLILAVAHMQNDEFILADHFLDEYIKRYANPNEKEYSEYMSVKAKYLALPHPRRDQAAIDEAIVASKAFEAKYPNSVYYPVVDTMLTKQYLARAGLNESIASLYDRVDKPKSAAYYRKLQKASWINWNEIDHENTPWYREWFEGDGTSSWYAFMIPKTQSVVSRNSIQSDENITTTEQKNNATK